LFESQDLSLILTAVKFAADKHRIQRRKSNDESASSAYINHPIDVSETLWRIGGVRDPILIAAAILHDTVEDTLTTPYEIERYFGPDVRRLVEEVSDDKTLPKPERKILQIEHAPGLSQPAKQIKLADKIFNVCDVTFRPPDWPYGRRVTYLDWAEQVVAGLRGCNSELENAFDSVMRIARRRMAQEVPAGRQAQQ
jgi:GTP diphosphokinase / guanosine-3',5'-bis(diphosphate) 3'-diphosphatase